jgi:cytochrome oxidase Cu insertion factor (SCO1/SenC/PrrC family)
MKYFLCFAVLFTIVLNTTHARSFNETIRISGNAKKGDTVKIYLWDHYFGQRYDATLQRRIKQLVCDNGSYSFQFDSIKGPVYFSMSVRPMGEDHVIENYLAFPGDSVNITRENNRHVSFSGKGAEAMACRFSMDSAHSVAFTTYKIKVFPNVLLARKESILYQRTIYAQFDSAFKAEQLILNARKPFLNTIQYQVLQADIIGNHALQKYGSYTTALNIIPTSIAVDSANHIKAEVNELFRKEGYMAKTDIPDDILSLSKKYVKAVLSYLRPEGNMKPIYQLIAERYKGLLRDQLLTVYALDSQTLTQSPEAEIKLSLQFIKTDYFREGISYLLSTYLRGVTAYNFTLEDMSGKMRSLSEFKGKRVVIDYWFTGCSACSQVYTGGLKATEEALKDDASVVFITIANDDDRQTWLNSINKNIYTSHSTINLFIGELSFDHPAITKYGVQAYPTLVIVDADGKIFYNGHAPRNKEDLVALIKSK